ncbi:MAG: FkbM family methyltransferase [Gammaproteobacteria bacterium]|nr:FkbM family methyltransferase [Gammaproteobacteria bacterium]
MSIIYFKNKFPFAKIIGFEPDPNSYAILKKNVAVNEFKDITLINAALSNIEGETDFFGEFNGESPNSLGGSIIQAWGDRGYTEKIRVKAVKLSNFITTEVDFLKLDVEGAELHVLEELGDKLTFIREMSLEVHSSNQEVTMGKINKVTSLLKKYNFSFNVVCKNIACLLPEKQHPWIKKITPHLHIISAKRAN